MGADDEARAAIAATLARSSLAETDLALGATIVRARHACDQSP